MSALTGAPSGCTQAATHAQDLRDSRRVVLFFQAGVPVAPTTTTTSQTTNRRVAGHPRVGWTKQRKSAAHADFYFVARATNCTAPLGWEGNRPCCTPTRDDDAQVGHVVLEHVVVVVKHHDLGVEMRRLIRRPPGLVELSIHLWRNAVKGGAHNALKNSSQKKQRTGTWRSRTRRRE
jgi:hypothetical protein